MRGSRLTTIVLTFLSGGLAALAQQRQPVVPPKNSDRPSTQTQGISGSQKRITRADAIQEKRDFTVHPNVALVIGVGDYPQGSGLSRLRFAAKDARQVAAELEQHGYLVRTLTNAEAIRGSVRRALQELSQAVDPDQGSFLFYFSGHGFAYDDVNYLATYGTTVDDLKSEGLSVSDVEKILKQSNAKRQLMFLDACRSEPTVGGKTVGSPSFVADRRQRLEQNTGLRILYSTRAGAVSYESDELQQGVFTYFLLKGMAGDASGYSREDRQKDGLVSFGDLTQFLVDNMRSYGVKRGQVQVPYESGESTGDFLVAAKALGENELRIVQHSGDESGRTPSETPTQTAVGPPVPPRTVSSIKSDAAAPPADQDKRAGIASIVSGAGQSKIASLPQVWRNTSNNQFYTFRFDAEHLYISQKASGLIVGDLTLKRDKKGTQKYEGISHESGCPGHEGALEVTSWSPTRIEARVERPNAGNPPMCGKAFGLGVFREWDKISFIPE